MRAAVGARASSCQRVAGTIFGAFHDLLSPERRMASHNNACPALTFPARGSIGPDVMSIWRPWAAAQAHPRKTMA